MIPTSVSDWLPTAQRALRDDGLAGWLLYDFRGINPVFGRFAPLPGLLSRRTFLYVPAEGDPTLLVHVIEAGSVPTDLGAGVRRYSSRLSLAAELADLLPEAPVAMEISPGGDNPYVSYVDAGTAELVRACGAEPVSSAEILQRFAAWTDAQLELHQRASEHVARARDLAFEFIALRSQMREAVRETAVQRVITDYFDEHGLEYGHPPIVGFGAHAGDPHYVPGLAGDAELAPGDAILIDLWCKLPEPHAPYADVTWMGVYGEASPELREVFGVVTAARDRALEVMRSAYAAGTPPRGCDVDRAVREVIAEAGYGDAFVHRTGHSLGTASTHGDAAHLDDFETRDTRRLVPGLGVTVEPGVYLETFGVRSEIDVYLAEDGPRVTTDLQTELEVVPVA